MRALLVLCSSLLGTGVLLGTGGCDEDLRLFDAGPDDGRAADARGEGRARDLSASDRAGSRPDGPFNLGSACASDLQCSAGLACFAEKPNGLCTRTCTDHATCGGTPFGCHQGRCRRLCDPRLLANPCRSDQVCRLDGLRAFCVADCRAAGCGTGLYCDQGTGLCLDPKGGSLGAPCGVGVGTCDGTPNGVCLQVLTWSKSFCTLPCSPFANPCPVAVKGASCLSGDAKGEYCLFTCKPEAPACPHASMTCTSLSGGQLHLCLTP